MLPVRPALAIALLTGAVASQVNPFVFFPQDPERQTVTCTSFVGRPDLANAAEALLELNPQHFRGIGDANGLTRYFGVYHWVADERLSTPETYDLVVRQGLASGGPDMTPAAELLRLTGLSTPPSTNPQRGTWIMTDGFGLQGGLLITLGGGSGVLPTHYVGIGLPANPLWPATDGHSLFRADMISANTSATVGENEHAGAPHPTWAGRTSQPSFSTPWTYILGPLLTSPNLHMGGIDPGSTRLGATGANYGMNGLWPDVGGNPRRDGVVMRVTDNIAPNGWAFAAASLAFQLPYFHWPFYPHLIGFSHVGSGTPGQPLSLGFAPMQNGVREFSLAMPGTIPTQLAGTSLVFQAIVLDANIWLGEWTNAQAVHF